MNHKFYSNKFTNNSEEFALVRANAAFEHASECLERVVRTTRPNVEARVLLLEAQHSCNMAKAIACEMSESACDKFYERTDGLDVVLKALRDKYQI